MGNVVTYIATPKHCHPNLPSHYNLSKHTSHSLLAQLCNYWLSSMPFWNREFCWEFTTWHYFCTTGKGEGLAAHFLNVTFPLLLLCLHAYLCMHAQTWYWTLILLVLITRSTKVAIWIPDTQKLQIPGFL